MILFVVMGFTETKESGDIFYVIIQSEIDFDRLTFMNNAIEEINSKITEVVEKNELLQRVHFASISFDHISKIFQNDLDL